MKHSCIFISPASRRWSNGSVPIWAPKIPSEIIGVVGDVKEGALDREPAPTVYYVRAHIDYNGMVFVVRTTNNPLAVVVPVRHIIHSLDSSLPVADIRIMDAIVRETFSRQRFSALLLGAGNRRRSCRSPGPNGVCCGACCSESSRTMPRRSSWRRSCLQQSPWRRRTFRAAGVAAHAARCVTFRVSPPLPLSPFFFMYPESPIARLQRRKGSSGPESAV
jgi:hypothetical protein